MRWVRQHLNSVLVGAIANDQRHPSEAGTFRRFVLQLGRRSRGWRCGASVYGAQPEQAEACCEQQSDRPANPTTPSRNNILVRLYHRLIVVGNRWIGQGLDLTVGVWRACSYRLTDRKHPPLLDR